MKNEKYMYITPLDFILSSRINQLLNLFYDEKGNITNFVTAALNDNDIKTNLSTWQKSVKPSDSDLKKIEDYIPFYLVNFSHIKKINGDLDNDKQLFINTNIATLGVNEEQTTKGKNILGFVLLFLEMKYLSYLENPNSRRFSCKGYQSLE